MKVTVLGASGGTGRAVTRTLLSSGHAVAALVRDARALAPAPGLDVQVGDALAPADVARAVAGADAVVVSLGNSQNPFGLLLGARRTTASDICASGTRNAIEAMRASGARRLVVVTAFGVGATRELPSAMTKLFFRLLLKEHMADKEQQELLVKASGLDWTLVQPVALTDRPATGAWLASDTGQVRRPELTRSDLASFLVRELLEPGHGLQTVTLSG